MQDVNPYVKAGVDGVAGLGVVATLAGWLPAFAAFLGVVWYLIQIWESAWGIRQRGRVKAFCSDFSSFCRRAWRRLPFTAS